MKSELENPHMKKLREDQIERVKDGSFIQNTRAVPGLVRYRLHWSDFDTANMEIDSMEGEYVLHSQATEIIAAKDKEIAELKSLFHNDGTPRFNEAMRRAEAAEAKLKAERDDKDAITRHTMKLEAELAEAKYMVSRAQVLVSDKYAGWHKDARAALNVEASND